jgi:hypothetical protein
MKATAILLLAATASLRVCGESPRPPAVNGAPSAEHGGSVATTGALTTEVSAEPNGVIVAYVKDSQQQPVQAHSVTVNVRRPDEDPVAVPMIYDERRHAYVGQVSGVAAGAYPVEVSVRPTATAQPVEMVSPPVQVTVAATPVPGLPTGTVAVAAPQAPRHGGRVQVVGEYTVETVAARGGDVALYFSDREGRPVPPAEVRVPTIQVQVEGRAVPVAPRLEGGVWVAHTRTPLTADVVVEVPEVEIRGHRHQDVIVPGVVVVAALPSAVVVAPRPVQAGVVVQTGVVVEPTIVAPSIVIAPALPGVVVVGGHHGDDDDHYHHGRGRGHGRGHGRGRGRGFVFFR